MQEEWGQRESLLSDGSLNQKGNRSQKRGVLESQNTQYVEEVWLQLRTLSYLAFTSHDPCNIWPVLPFSFSDRLIKKLFPNSHFSLFSHPEPFCSFHQESDLALWLAIANKIQLKLQPEGDSHASTHFPGPLSLVCDPAPASLLENHQFTAHLVNKDVVGQLTPVDSQA